MVEIVVEILVGINLIRSGLYGEDRVEIYFIILKLITSIFKFFGKYKKNIMEMTWLLTWLNMSVTILNTTL